MSIFSDVVALARAGYTPKEVRELMELEKQKPSEEVPETTPKEEVQPEEQNEPEDTVDADAQKAPEDRTAELQKQINDLKKQLAEAQKKNTKLNLQSDDKVKSEQEKLEEIARSFM